MKSLNIKKRSTIAEIGRSISDSTSAVKELGRTPTFIYSVAILIVIWAVGLLYASADTAAWENVAMGDRWQVTTVMCLILLAITVLSLFPVGVYATFNRLERQNAFNHILSELDHYKMRKPYLVSEIRRHFNAVYDPRTYTVPMLLATLAIMVGWVLFFFSQGPDVVTDLMGGHIQVLFYRLKTADPVVLGFLGAFFFSLQMLFQRYIARDLKASVFMHIAVRIWVVMILTMVIGVVLWAGRTNAPEAAPWGLLAASFLVGIFPNVGLDLIKRAARPLGIKSHLTSPNVSLDKIQGLNLWHQARLAEEDIDSVQNLAMSDITGLIANTRLGIMRLLHWVDQALLIVHVGEDALERFHRAGIHTATDFEAVYVGQLPEDEHTKFYEREMESYMGQKGPSHVPEVPPGLLESLREAEPKKSERNESIKTPGKDEGLEDRVRNMMIAICDDVNYQRLWKIRHGKPIQRERE